MQKMKVKISPSVWAMGVSALFSQSLAISKICVILSTALIHETGHFIAARFLKIRIKRIKIDIFGAAIGIDPLSCSYKKEAVLCLAGPLANILSALLASALHPSFDLDLFAVSSIFFATINLLPARHFDGGRILLCLMLRKLPVQTASLIIEVSSFVCVFLLWTVSVYFIMRTGAYLSLFVFSGALFSKLFLMPVDSAVFKE